MPSPGVESRRGWNFDFLGGAFIYAIPALFVYLIAIIRTFDKEFFRPSRVLVWAPIFGFIVLLGIGFILRSRDFEYWYPDEDSTIGINLDVKKSDLRLEYRELNADIRKRDHELTRMNYYLFAILGLLAAVYVRGTGPEKPFVTVMGGLFTFYFLVLVTSQTGALRALRARRESIECAFEDQPFALGRTSTLMADHQGNQMDPRPRATHFSASGLSVFIHWVVLLLWVGLYLLSLIYWLNAW